MFGSFGKKKEAVPPKVAPRPAARPPAAPAAQKPAPVAGAAGSPRPAPAAQPLPDLKTIGKNAILSLSDGKYPAPPTFGSSYALIAQGDEFIELSSESFPADNQRTPYMQYKSSLLSDGVRTRMVKLDGGAIRDLLERFESSKQQDADAPIEEAKNFFSAIVKEAAQQKVSDVHFIVRRDSAIVLFRVFGEITQQKRYEPAYLAGVLSAVYNKMHDPRSNSAAAFSTILPTYCTITLPDLNTKLRWQTVPLGYDGNFDVVCRLIAKGASSQPMTLEQLGYLPSQARALEMAAMTPRGGIFIAGVTGSGKSKTLQTMMSLIAKGGSKKIYTVEDPIEYPMFGVSQTMIQRNLADKNASAENPFATAMKTFMRADPDVIMAGEIRDSDSAQVAEDIIRSGHHLLTTVHASSALGIVGRLTSRDIGMSRDTLSEPDFLSLLVYQHLVPRLCQHCKALIADHPAASADYEMVTHLFDPARYGLDPATVFARHEEGCEHCKNGVAGLTVCAEVIAPGKDFEMLRAFRESRMADALQMYRARRHARYDEPDCDGKTAIESAIYKVSQGILDPRDVQSLFGAFGMEEITHRG